VSGPLVAFFILAGIVLTAAVIIVTTRNIVHAVFLHLLAMSCVGGLYILLYAEFIGAVQILIYAGAVTTMILFTLMLTKARGGIGVALDNPQKGMAFLTALSFLIILLVILVPKSWPVKAAPPIKVSLASFGSILFESYVLPFEMISILLLAALIGVVVLARKEE
jgi:NADH:ubiquinone oxidoreductase subunit 6 (subunit J)